MSRYHNDAGEPLMTAAQARLEADIDAQNAEEDRAGLNDMPGHGEHPCRHCGELTAHRFLNEHGECDRDDCLIDRGLKEAPPDEWIVYVVRELDRVTMYWSSDEHIWSADREKANVYRKTDAELICLGLRSKFPNKFYSFQRKEE